MTFDDPSRPNVAGNPLPSHPDPRVNAIAKNGGKRTKTNVTEVKTPTEMGFETNDRRGINHSEFGEETRRDDELLPPDINDMSDTAIDSGSPFEQDMCPEEP
ncbi:hypothetical protein GOBAR_DD14416 [Gossypium barbadense]|nr:hypothetical protein GOBAR_DD14416 [Gossypium barbadense]